MSGIPQIEALEASQPDLISPGGTYGRAMPYTRRLQDCHISDDTNEPLKYSISFRREVSKASYRDGISRASQYLCARTVVTLEKKNFCN